VRHLAFLNATFETGIDNPIDAAIVSAGKQGGLSTTGHAKIDEIPYLFLDPPKADAARVLGDLAKLNVEVKVITGDNRFVTGHLAATVGLDPTSMLTGEALTKLDDEALWHAAPTTSLFAEIDPQQ